MALHPRPGPLLFVTGLWLLSACSFDWGSLDPRVEQAPGTGGSTTTGSGSTTGSTTGSGGAGGAGGAGGSVGAAGAGGTGTTSAGGQAGDPWAICVTFCVDYFECLTMGGVGGGGVGGVGGGGVGLRQLCQQECASIVAGCAERPLQILLACFQSLETCDDLMTVDACLDGSPCAGG